MLARAVSDFGESVDLPVFHLSTLLGFNPAMLVFPDATGGQSRSNLIVANLVAPGAVVFEPVTLGLDIRDSAGAIVGNRNITLEAGEQRLIIDVANFLGIAALDRGQLRVTRISGTGQFWAILAVVRADGSLSISLGENQ